MAEIKKMSKQAALKLLQTKSNDPDYIVTLGEVNKFFEDYTITDTEERIGIMEGLVATYKQ